MIEVKLCGIRTLEQAGAAAEAGADYIGFIFADGRRHIEPNIARDIVRMLGKPGPRFVGVLVNPKPSDADDLASYVGLDFIQLSGEESLETVRHIQTPVIKAVHVRPNKSPLSEAEVYAPNVRLVLLDTYSLAASGGTGQLFEWRLAEQVARRQTIMLAGGLTPENVGEAVRVVHPAAVDVSSGIETNGEKDTEKMRKFVRAVREADK